MAEHRPLVLIGDELAVLPTGDTVESDVMPGGAGLGDVSSNTSVSVDSELAVFSGTGGKTIKRFLSSGYAKLTSGVVSALTALQLKTELDLQNVVNVDTSTTANITDSTNKRFLTDAQQTKLGHISVTQSVDLDQIESDTATNNAKVTNATHTGEVTGATALTVDKTAISNRTQATPAGADFILFGDTSDGGNLKKGLISDLPGGGGGGGGIANVVEDTTPQLGGNLDLNGFTVGAATAADLTKLNALTPTATELNYVDGVTSAIQGQIDGKQPLDSDLTAIAGLSPSNDDFLQRKSGAWANRTVAQVKTDLSLTGTNSGDQTSIVGITGTKAQFNTALTDDDFATLGGTETFTGEKTFNNRVLFDKATAAVPFALTDAATISVDASEGDLFRVTLGGNRTLGNPTNATDGQIIVFDIKQDATGSRTLALDTKFIFGTDLASLTLTTAANKVDVLTVQYIASADKFRVLSVSKGFAS